MTLPPINKNKYFAKTMYWALLVLMVLPLKHIFGTDEEPISPPIALFIGLTFALIFGKTCPIVNKKISKYLLQISVVGLGFGMNLVQSLRSGVEGMLFTIISVIVVMLFGVFLGKQMKIEHKTSYLISSGTAICGGSAIAAVGGAIKANENQMAVSLGVVFILNAIALFIFPPLGVALGMTDTQFGTWAAIAIHDTSSVVGAGQAFSPTACEIATLIKCTRALWIIPLAFITAYIFRNHNTDENKTKVSIPWFIVLFVVAMIINTYTPESLLSTMKPIYTSITLAAKKSLIAVLFAIGAGLSIDVIRQVGIRPLVLAIVLWVGIGVSSLFVVLNTID